MTRFKKLLALTLVFVGAIGLAGCNPTVEGPSDLEMLAEALLEVDLADEASSDLTLPSSGLHDVVITWESSNTDVITDAGEVTIPTFTEGDQVVTITASLTLGDDTLTKTFEVTVLAATVKTDAEKLAEAKVALLLPVAGLVLSDITLPATALDAAVTWASSNTAAITNAGVVTRPLNGEGNEVVTLTATLTIGTETTTKTFEVTVREEEPSNVFTSIVTMHADSILGDIVEFQGIVTSIFDGGYFLSDGTYAVGVYNPASTLSLAIGDEVYVKGSYAVYNTLFQIGSVTEENLVSTGNANPLTAVVKTVAEMIALDASDPLIHGMYYTITGTVEFRGDYDNVFIVDGDDAVLIYYYSLEASLDALSAEVGKVVTITVFYYTNHATNGPMLAFDGLAADIDVATLNDVDALAADLAAVETGIPSVTLTDITLPATGPNGTVYTAWTSSDTAVMTDAGVFVAAAATTVTVTFTGTGTKGTETGTATIEVVVPILSTVAEVSAMAAGDNFYVTGVVYEETYYGFYIHAAGAYAFVYAQDLVDTVEPGQEITILGFLGEYSGLLQLNVVSYTLGSTGNALVDAIVGTVADVENDVIPRGTIVTVTGTITIEGSYDDVYINGAEGGKVKVYYRSNADELVSFEGQVVVLDIIGYQDGTVLFNGLAADVTIFVLSDTDALAADLAVVGAAVPSITVTDITLPATGTNGTVYTNWASSNTAIITDAGVFVATDTTTVTVTFTATATKGTETGTATIEVVVPILSTVAEVLAMTPGDDFQVTGVVYEESYYGFFIHAAGNYIFVYDNSFLDSVVPGQEITIEGYLGEYSGLLQVNVISYTTGTATDNTLVDAIVGTVGELENDLVPRGTILTVTGTVSIEGSYDNVYITGPAGGKVAVYYRSNADEIAYIDDNGTSDDDTDDFEAGFAGQIVTLDLIAYQNGTVLFNGLAADITAETAFTDAQKAADAAAVLDLGDNDNVEQDLTLPADNTMAGATITWATSDAAVVTAAGVITQTVGADTTATLTATVTVGTEVVTRDFVLTVLDANDSVPLSVTEALALADGDSVLVVGVITGMYYDERVIQGSDGAAIWVDSSIGGDIGDEIVVRGTLATYTSNSNNARQLDSATKIETLSVGNALVVDAETDPDVIVTKYAEMRTYTATLTVDSFDSYGFVFFDTGTEAMKLKFSYSYYAPYFMDVYAVTDTVLVSFTVLNVDHDHVQIVNIVLPDLTEAQNMLAAKGALVVPDIAVTDITLDTANADYGATITWATSDATAITTAGVVTRPANGAGDATVTLTATVVVGALTEDVVFTVTVTEEAAPFVPVGTEIFISEYIEGSNSNKAIELFNPSANPITLTGYSIELYSNGATAATNTLDLSGVTIAAGGVYVIYNSSAWTEISDVGDVTSSITYFNGDDAVALLKDSVVIDVIGVIGVDPGSNWVVGTGSTGEHTLVRAVTVYGPNATWTPGEWVVYDQNTFTYLGAHIVTPAS